MTVSIREEAEGDIPSIRRVNELAFERDNEARLVDELRGRVSPFISLVAELDSAIVGHILFTPVIVRDRDDSWAGMSLGPMAVLPSHQRRGVGKKLVEGGLDACRRLRCAMVFVLGHPEYYPRFGFKPAADVGITCEFECPPEAFMAIALAPQGLRGVRGLVTYPAPFHALA